MQLRNEWERVKIDWFLGSDDLRASDSQYSRPRGIFRPISDIPDVHTGWPFSKSIYDDPSAAAERIHVPGYR